MFVTWSHDIPSATGDATTAKLDVDVDFHWYNNAIESAGGAAMTKYMVWELMVLNPDETNYYTLLKDSWESTLQVDGSSPGANTLDTLTVKFVNDNDLGVNAAANRYSLADFAYTDSATRLLDKNVAPANSCTNDLTKTTADTTDMCTEKWNITTSKVRCVRATLSFSRPFLPASFSTAQNKCDVSFDYRKYEFTAKWKYDGAATEPGNTNFNSQKNVVDFGRFLLPPETAYGSAASLSFALASSAVGILFLTF